MAVIYAILIMCTLQLKAVQTLSSHKQDFLRYMINPSSTNEGVDEFSSSYFTGIYHAL